MTTRAAWLSLSLVFLASSACTPETKERADDKKVDKKVELITRKVDHANVGIACISAGVDSAPVVTVNFGLCLSSSCDRLDSASCSFEQTGSDLKVNSKATVISDARRDTICTTDCRTASATCTGPTLAAGTYALVYGDAREEVTVPVADMACTYDPRFD